jgi:hypothetical protein
MPYSWWLAALSAVALPRFVGAQSATLSYAYGATWQARDAQRDMLIFEYYDAWRGGDAYVYFETDNLATRHDASTTTGSGATTPYGEVHARLRFGDLLGNSILGAYQIDVSQGDVVLLTGTAVSWRVVGRTILNTDVFVRYDPSLAGVTWQVVAYGEWPFRIGPARLSYGGYIKFVGPEHPQAAFMVSDTRLVWEPVSHLRLGMAFRAGYQQIVPEAVIQWRF